MKAPEKITQSLFLEQATQSRIFPLEKENMVENNQKKHGVVVSNDKLLEIFLFSVEVLNKWFKDKQVGKSNSQLYYQQIVPNSWVLVPEVRSVEDGKLLSLNFKKLSVIENLFNKREKVINSYISETKTDVLNNKNKRLEFLLYPEFKCGFFKEQDFLLSVMTLNNKDSSSIETLKKYVYSNIFESKFYRCCRDPLFKELLLNNKKTENSKLIGSSEHILIYAGLKEVILNISDKFYNKEWGEDNLFALAKVFSSNNVMVDALIDLMIEPTEHEIAPEVVGAFFASNCLNSLNVQNGFKKIFTEFGNEKLSNYISKFIKEFVAKEEPSLIKTSEIINLYVVYGLALFIKDMNLSTEEIQHFKEFDVVFQENQEKIKSFFLLNEGEEAEEFTELQKVFKNLSLARKSQMLLNLCENKVPQIAIDVVNSIDLSDVEKLPIKVTKGKMIDIDVKDLITDPLILENEDFQMYYSLIITKVLHNFCKYTQVEYAGLEDMSIVNDNVSFDQTPQIERKFFWSRIDENNVSKIRVAFKDEFKEYELVLPVILEKTKALVDALIQNSLKNVCLYTSNYKEDNKNNEKENFMSEILYALSQSLDASISSDDNANKDLAAENWDNSIHLFFEKMEPHLRKEMLTYELQSNVKKTKSVGIRKI